ncbi:LexA family protein [Rubrivirga marina]|uniref:LexA family protein n=1 Tax=Rubrivirga marina TaxID=1196024 RepID=UPI000BA91B6B|nr:translesion error-prone DNA polymerase V autoproteolytic subunit [Rubrivirga marina]
MPLALTPPPATSGRVTVIGTAADLPPGPWLPFFASDVAAGFPSPADDYAEGELDLRDLLGASSPSVFFCRAEGWSMRDEGIRDGDVLVVDRAIEPESGMVVVAAVDGELTVKRYVRRGERVVLLAANPDHEPIELLDGQDLVVWGVVTSHVGFHLPNGKGLRRVAA